MTHSIVRARMVMGFVGVLLFVAGALWLRASHTSTVSSTADADWVTYQSIALGFTFRLPSTYHVFQPDDTHLRVVSDYRSRDGSAREITLYIRKYSTHQLTPGELGITGISHTTETHNGYILIRSIQEGSWVVYFLGDKGTFSFSSTLDAPLWTSKFKTEGVYNYYQSTFEQIVNTVQLD